MDKSLTVIIPVYNRAELLPRALDSVLAQSCPADEIIVIDDASIDGTALVLESYRQQIEIIRFSENRGVSAARNAGIEMAASTWIALLDSDDEWLPNKMEEQWNYLANHPHLTILQSDEIWIRHGKRVNAMKKHRKFGGDIFLSSLPLCIVSPSAVLFRKDIFKEIGGFREDLPVCEDYDLWLRWSLSYPFGLLDSPGIYKYGGHEDQLSRRYWGMDRYRILSMNMLLNDARLSTDKRGALLLEMQKKLNIYLGGLAKRDRRDEEFEAIQLKVNALLNEDINNEF